MSASATPGSRTAELLDWATSVGDGDIPPPARAFTAGLLLKTVTSMVIGAREPFGRQVLAHGARTAGPAEASVVGGGYATDLESAALVNGTLSHQTESEDCYFTTDTRESASTAWIFPALLGAAEHAGASGADLVTAALVSFEVASRLLVASPGLGSVRGINTASWFGTPATAVGVGRLLGLEPGQVGHAMSIALSQAAGLGHQTGFDAHKLEAGHACRAGTLSALLAAEGATGAPDVVDTGLAFAPVLPDGVVRLDRVTDGLGQGPFYVERVEYKKYPACGMVHAAVDSLAELLATEGVGEADVDAVVVEVDPIAAEYCDRPLPATVDEARFSFPFALAAVLLDGRVGYGTYSPEALVDPARRAAQAKVEVVADGERPPRDNGARLQVALRGGGTVRREVDGFLGHPNDPIPVGTMVDLLREDLAPHLGPDLLDEVVGQVAGLDGLPSVAPLCQALRHVHDGRA